MLEHLISRGYKLGGGLISPSGVFYLNIPKNASTFLTNVLEFNGWTHTTIDNDNITHCIVILRDPIERWVSGFSTYVASWILGNGYGSDHYVQDYNSLTERIIFDNLIFDDHTTEQVKYVIQLPDIKTTFFKLNDSMLSEIEQFTNQTLIIEDTINDNNSENNYDTKSISKFMSERIKQDPFLASKIVDAYSKDYELIRSANFYVTPRM